MLGAVEKSVAHAGNGALSQKQVRTLIVEAQKAWRVQKALEHSSGALPPPEPFDVWRKAALQDVVPKMSFRALSNAEFVPVLNYFRQLACRKPLQKTAEDDDRARAMWCLRREMTQAEALFGGREAVWGYVGAIARDQFGKAIKELSAEEVWKALYTFRARRRAKAKRPADLGAALGGKA